MWTNCLASDDTNLQQKIALKFAERLLSLLNGDEPLDAATLGVVRAYLKDNNIELLENNEVLNKIIKEVESENLPFKVAQ